MEQKKVGISAVDFNRNYRHKRNGVEYMPLEIVSMQIDQEWVPALVYTTVEKGDKKFVRSVEDFLNRFEKL